MKKYESAIIVKPEIVDKKLKKFIEKVTTKLSEKTKVTEIKELGLRRLAYTIRGNNEGYYVFHEFEIADNEDNKAIIKKIEKYLKTQEEIIKSIVVERG